MSDRVLLVDDEEEFVETLAERMRNRGMEVDTSGSGEEALELVGEGSYDVVVLDLQMPGMDGLEALERIKRQRPNIQVVLLTGYGTVDSGVEAMKRGAVEFLQKPVDLAALSEAISTAKAKRMVLLEESREERIKDILKTHGW